MDTSPEYIHVFQCTSGTLRTQYLSERKCLNKTVEKDKTHLCPAFMSMCVIKGGMQWRSWCDWNFLLT